jgi:hypothetical protein
MSEGTGTWWPEGSGQGRVSAAPPMREPSVQEAEADFRKHVRQCNACYVDGIDCDTAAALRQAWRDSKETHSNHAE